ncbi:MAG: hypothetical protein RL595_1753 [Planctomycetota bacterium]|jgi:hypothetical protein
MKLRILFFISVTHAFKFSFFNKSDQIPETCWQFGLSGIFGGTLATVREVFLFQRVFFNQPLAFTPAILETNGIQDLARRDGFINDT